MPPRTQWSPKSFEIVLPEEAIVELGAGTTPERQQPAHDAEAAAERTKGPLRFNSPFSRMKARRTRSSISATRFHIADLHVPSAGVAARTERRRAAAEEHDIHGRDRVRHSRPSIRIPTFRHFVARTQRRARRWSSRFRAPDPCRAKNRARAGGPAGGRPWWHTRRRHRRTRSIPPIRSASTSGGSSEGLHWCWCRRQRSCCGNPLARRLRVPRACGKPAAGVGPVAGAAYGGPATKNSALLNVLKEELFALESEKLTGNMPAEEYAEVKAALETVLKRALKRNS